MSRKWQTRPSAYGNEANPEKTYALDKDNREALLVLGALAVSEAQPQVAKQFLERALQLYPESGRT